jgi:hypothetical protein
VGADAGDHRQVEAQRDVLVDACHVRQGKSF